LKRFIEFENSSGDQVFLAVDHISAAVYAVKKDASENQLIIWTGALKSTVAYGSESDRVWELLRKGE
jgi:hypothetical protein